MDDKVKDLLDRIRGTASVAADAAAEIGESGDLKKRIELGEGGDELHMLADRFNDMFARLDAAFEKERQFTADASHEMRTPMSVIMAQCELALDGKRSEADYVKALQVIQRQGRKMTKLIADIQKKMEKAAADLNFEAAAEYRDKMIELKGMLRDL